MFEGLDFSKMGEIFQKIQEQGRELEEKIKSTQVTAKGGGGMISISANGAGEIVDLSIDDSLLEDKESLEILLMSTINDLFKMIEDNKKSQALSMLGELGRFKE
ncbi:MAG: YbaB/EbfC family nucleoid-associated protein [Epsilonproteobacteria bacterium]|nr:YbaB/EbfC family nucleoid-associated protein [Campylobacterota bacterium]